MKDKVCEGLWPTGVWLKCCVTAGKPGGKRRKQTSTCSFRKNPVYSTKKEELNPSALDSGGGDKMSAEWNQVQVPTVIGITKEES
jgi:hypothetical protein